MFGKAKPSSHLTDERLPPASQLQDSTSGRPGVLSGKRQFRSRRGMRESTAFTRQSAWVWPSVMRPQLILPGSLRQPIRRALSCQKGRSQPRGNVVPCTIN